MPPLRILPRVAAAALCTVIGAVAGLLGMGGGELRLPVLGLGAAPPTSGGISPPSRPSPPPGGRSTNQCSHGIDDDGDGQVDAPSERKLRLDPGA